MKLKALLFDVDGTLANTERDGHRIAFNLAFKKANLNWEWDEALYGKLLAISGGKERISFYMKEYLDDLQVDNRDDFIKGLHKSKTDFYVELLEDSKIPLRVGIRRILQEAKDSNMRMAIVTTTSIENVKALLSNTIGKEAINDFELIAAGDIVPNKKPANDIYLWALDKMNLDADECLAFEDSYNGVSSSVGANIKTIATINDYTKDEDTSKASLIVDQLGCKNKKMEVIAGDALGYDMISLEMIKKWF